MLLKARVDFAAANHTMYVCSGVLTQDEGIQYVSGAFASIKVPEWHSQHLDDQNSKLDYSSLLNISSTSTGAYERVKKVPETNLTG